MRDLLIGIVFQRLIFIFISLKCLIFRKQFRAKNYVNIVQLRLFEILLKIIKRIIYVSSFLFLILT